MSYDWYAARASGVVAYALITVSVLLGLLLSGRARPKRWPAFAVTDVHRFAGILAGVFVGVHVLTLALDSVVPISLPQLLVPGASHYRPFWVGLGTVAGELLVAVAVTTRLKKRLGFARWKRWHYLSFAVWLAATAHGIGAGTDANEQWLRLLYVCAVGSVAGAIAWRVGRTAAPAPARS
ncbi:MAG TPA: ferric reductase-like transmembrane domain-containing protein [Gaiellaceae bacterium]|nr:ferric reductase-like transmembrane domain-containing protein [Gaiellaceae bacterium]